MKHKVLFLLAGILTILVVECNRTTPVSPNQTITLTPGPGAFGLGYMKGLSKSTANAAVKSGANVNFDLGSIKGSTAFYFLLYNIGNTPITDVTLSVDGSDFTVYPSGMDTLIPGGDVGMLPVVKVNAFHGTPLDGTGYRPLMKKGLNTATLRISGATKTVKGKDTTITLSAILDLQALVMDFKLFGRTGSVNFGNPWGRSMGNINLPDSTSLTTWNDYYPANFIYNPDPTYAPGCYSDNYRDTSINLSNTGNVAMHVYLYNSGKAWGLDTVVPAGDSILIANPNAYYVIDGDHTIADPRKFALQNDGRFYFNFSLPVASTCGQTTSIGTFTAMALNAICADSANLLYLIDSTVVFWDRQGTCPDNSYAYTLFSVHSVDSVLCRRNDSVAGPQEQCMVPSYHAMLDTIIANLSSMDLGIGGTHQVDPIPLK